MTEDEGDFAGLALGVCVAPLPAANASRAVAYPHYVREILAHAGVCAADVPFEDLEARLPHLRLLLTIGELPAQADLRTRLQQWVEAGGGWLSVGGTSGVPELFGARLEVTAYSGWGGGTGTLGEGYLSPAEDAHPVLAHLRRPLHFFNGCPVEVGGGDARATVLDAHQRPTSRAGVLEASRGRGRCLLIAPDVTGSVVRIQQGCAVTRDGVPSPDGSAPVCDGLLKSDDGAVLDWLFDRQPVPGAPGLQAFLEPAADQWRELLLRALLYLASRQGVRLPVLWYYPRGLSALAHLSHDSDGNDPDQAFRLLDTLAGLSVHSTWCILPPGYPPAVIAAIRDAGHELAMHFDALSAGTQWSEAAFDSQWRGLTALFNEQPPVTNKNHYLRWEGDTEFFDWCAARGIKLDQSKGVSKTGEAGFNFGTCHPYLPLAPDGRRIDVLELPTPTQDLLVFAPAVLADALLDAVERSHGVLHLLFHPAHTHRPEVAQALVDAVNAARGRGLEWWTAQQIGDWERARRQVAWRPAQGPGGGVILQPAADLPEATLLWLLPDVGQVSVNGSAAPPGRVTRWGFEFGAVTAGLHAGKEQALTWDG